MVPLVAYNVLNLKPSVFLTFSNHTNTNIADMTTKENLHTQIYFYMNHQESNSQIITLFGELFPVSRRQKYIQPFYTQVQLATVRSAQIKDCIETQQNKQVVFILLASPLSIMINKKLESMIIE